MTILPRTCTELRDEKGMTGGPPAPAKPLCAFRGHPAYVLLGDPGMGKSTAFLEEAAALGSRGLLVSARDLANLDADRHPEWKNKTLLIDGLDEIRAGRPDPRTPLDRIRRNLEKLGKPRFRLSCRHADWLTTDRASLATCSPLPKVTVLSLDPLNEQQATQLLGDSNVRDAQDFIEEARNRGVEGLLRNPQTLGLLVRAVVDGAWPAGRKETFEKACLAMAGEYNEEHLNLPSRPNPSRILDTAGRLCAMQLVSGVRGCATMAARASADYPDMAVCGSSRDDCRQAAASRLFRHAGEGRTEPVHRHIAEYSAARHIATLIQSGLPTLRVLALISGPDGQVVPELRGLSAWLAAHSPIARPHLIERDAVGLALYGDIRAFSTDQHRSLFDSLIRQPRKLEPTHRMARAFASLVSHAMLPVLEDNIRNPPDEPDGELVADFVLRLLREATPQPSLRDVLLETVRDNSRWPRVKNAALAVIVHYSQHTGGVPDLLALLRDIREGRLVDPANELLGQLLIALYPRHVSPRTVWDYIEETDEPLGGTYAYFWTSHLPSTSSDATVAQLLDNCSNRLPELERASGATLESCVARLLARGLETHGDGLDTARLYNWLDVAFRLRVGQSASRDRAVAIRGWIEARQQWHLDLLLEGVRRLPDTHWYSPYEAFQRLFGAAVSPEFYWKCAKKAKSMYGGRRATAESLLRFAVQAGALDPRRLRNLVADNPDLATFLQGVLAPPPPSSEHDRLAQERQERLNERQLRLRQELEYLQANEGALRNNRAPPALLHRLAQTYFGDFVGFTPDLGAERLKELVAPHRCLLDSARMGLRMTLQRNDVPDAEQILEQRLSSKMDLLCWPYLVGLAESEQDGALTGAWWTDAHIRTALAFYFGYAHGDYEPAWYQYLVVEHPATVAAVQVRFAGALFQQGIDNGNTNLWHLAFDRSHAQVAAHACLPLLRAFPARAKRGLLGELEYLLLAAIQHADRARLEQLITRRLSRKSMPPRQCARWLAAGCIVAPTRFAPAARAFLGDGRQQQRALGFASFFCLNENTVSPVECVGIDLAALLVWFVGRFVKPDPSAQGRVAPVMEASALVRQCIRILAQDSRPRATVALADLLGDPGLTPWRYALDRAADDQRIIRSDCEYRYPTAAQVAETLQGGASASPADLAALMLDRLDTLALGMRSGNTDDWKEFWNEVGQGGPTTPKPEPSCVRALVRGLRRLCPAQVKVDREVCYPSDARPDISVSQGDYRVPIEVKRNNSRDLWRAAKTQLIAKYTIEPATGGHGIYVVLWFGRADTQFSPTGARPATPTDLQRQLEAVLTDQERRTVYVRVIDVAPHPNSPK